MWKVLAYSTKQIVKKVLDRISNPYFTFVLAVKNWDGTYKFPLRPYRNVYYALGFYGFTC